MQHGLPLRLIRLVEVDIAAELGAATIRFWHLFGFGHVRAQGVSLLGYLFVSSIDRSWFSEGQRRLRYSYWSASSRRIKEEIHVVLGLFELLFYLPPLLLLEFTFVHNHLADAVVL